MSFYTTVGGGESEAYIFIKIDAKFNLINSKVRNMSVVQILRDNFVASLHKRGIHYGWVMTFLAFLYALFSSAAMGVPSVLIVPMAKELGWSLGDLSAPQGLRLALFGLAAPFAGGLMLRYGPRRMVSISGAMLIIGLIVAITTTAKWQLWLGQGQERLNMVWVWKGDGGSCKSKQDKVKFKG